MSMASKSQVRAAVDTNQTNKHELILLLIENQICITLVKDAAKENNINVASCKYPVLRISGCLYIVKICCSVLKKFTP